MSLLPDAPPRRSRALPWRDAEMVALDFEATGLDYSRDRIVSFGTVPIRRGRIDVGDARYELVDPGDVTVDPSSVILHGLRPVDLRGEQDQTLARESLREELEGRFVVSWYASVEISFLTHLFASKVGAWRKRVIDVRNLVYELLGEASLKLSLTEAAEALGVPVASPHHALDDALVTAQLFMVCAAKLRSRGVRTVADLMDLGPRQEPVLRRPRAPQ